MTMVSLTKSDTLAIRMAEMAIATYLTTSARMVMRPVFQEVNIRVFKPESDAEEILRQSIIVKISFLHNQKLMWMACECFMENKIGSGDWQPTEVGIFDREGSFLQSLKFNDSGHISTR